MIIPAALCDVLNVFFNGNIIRHFLPFICTFIPDGIGYAYLDLDI